MPSIREDLQRRVTEELKAGLPTPVPSKVLDRMAERLVQQVGQWLAQTYDDHSVSFELYGEATPTVARPSLEWLCESMRE